jgi:hypothetical protein
MAKKKLKKRRSKKREIERLLACALTQRSDHIRNFLSEVQLPRSGNKAELRDRLREYLTSVDDGMRRLTSRLNELDGWGNQHAYLYKSTSAHCRTWRREAHVKKVLRENKVARLLNASRALVLPKEPTLATVQWSKTRVRFVWNETREWHERRDDLDYANVDGGAELEYRAWQRRRARGTIAFDWDLTTGEAMLIIQRLPSGSRYAEMRDEVINWLHPFIDVTTLDVVRVSRSVKKLLDSGEIRNRKTNWETLGGAKADLASAGRSKGVRDDELLSQMEALGKKKMQPRLGNMYWLPAGDALESELHTVIHRRDQRVAIFGQRLQKEVRYVIGRIRSYCR